MSLYNDTNPQHLGYLARHKAAWTPEKEAALQRELIALGIKKEKLP